MNSTDLRDRLHPSRLTLITLEMEARAAGMKDALANLRHGTPWPGFMFSPTYKAGQSVSQDVADYLTTIYHTAAETIRLLFTTDTSGS